MIRGPRRLRDALEVILPIILPFSSRSLGAGLLREFETFPLGPPAEGFGMFDSEILIAAQLVKLADCSERPDLLKDEKNSTRGA